ncbi:MAG: hypothetical protein KME17_13650 [Cyanosarcina radialis HA8281-LM2]|jgi:hypothetical protein|nr:hypothetical protein [Cyanosarcina radialis HA8281-LM2]
MYCDYLVQVFTARVCDVAQESLLESASNLSTRLNNHFLTRAIFDRMQIPPADFGPGNLNALTLGNYNKVGLVGWLVQKGIMPPSKKAPFRVGLEGAVNYPPMWFAADDNWVQWFAQIHHPGARDWIQSVSSSAVRPPKMISALKEKVFLASIDFDNIEQIEDSLDRLRPPKWPENVLGRLDRQSIDRGKLLFAENCAQCHVQSYEPPNSLGIKVKKRLAYDVGTDPVAYQQFKEHGEQRATELLNLANKMLQLREAQLTKKFDKDVAANYAKHDSQGRPNQFGLAQEEGYSGSEKDSWEKSGAVYWASPLEGIFASSPYLHNGSIPTLSDLLSAPEQRPTTFKTGGTELDPKLVGLKGSGSFVYDTREPGKGNGGHSFGTALSTEQKVAPIEYLKSL